MRVLVLGSSGFLGRLLVDELLGAGHAVEGWSRTAVSRKPVSHAPPERECEWKRVDLAGAEPLPIPREPWDAIVCAAGPSVPARFTAEVDGAATLRIVERALDHATRHAPGARFLAISSAHVLEPSDVPLAEDAPLVPLARRSAYCAAKLAVERAVAERADVLDVVIARLFGSLGPGLPDGLFVPDLLRRLATREPDIALRGPDGVRDLTDGRDVARALRLLVEARAYRFTAQGATDHGFTDHGFTAQGFTDHAATYHLGTGKGVRLAELARRIAHALRSSARITFAPEGSQGPAPKWIAEPRRLEVATGWKPRHDLDETIAWLVGDGALAAPSLP